MSSKSIKRVGVIDVGSNSIKLVIAIRGDKTPIEIEDFISEETRIGEGMTGNPPIIDQNSILRGAAAIGRLARIAATKTDKLAIVATSAVRDAANKQAFIDEAEKTSGQPLRVLSGDEEASLIGRGMLCDPELKSLEAFSIIDLGGGSLECIQFADKKSKRSQSMQLGAVRLASLFLSNRDIPLTSESEEAISNHVLTTWQNSVFEPKSSPSPIAVITGGTSSVLADSIRKKRISLKEFTDIKDKICKMNFRERVTSYGIPESRADIFPTALVTLVRSLEYLGCDTIQFSKYNLRHGLADQLLSK